MRPLRPSSWPVALKLSLIFLAVALVPMGLTAAYNLHQSLLTKDYPEHPILMSRSVAEGLRSELGLRVESLGLIAVKGRAEPVDVSALHVGESATGNTERAAG